MTMRPDPTFHASPKLAMEAPQENFAYTLLLSPDFSKPGCDLGLQPHIGGRSLACDQPGEPALSRFLLSLIHHRHGQERPRVLTVVLFPAPRRGGSR